MFKLKALAVTSLLFLQSCALTGLFSSVEYEPALSANAAQKAVYDSTVTAFRKVVNSSNADAAVKAQLLEAIRQDEQDFQLFNSSLQTFLSTVGDVDPDRVIELSMQIYDKINQTSLRGR